jgi:uncharacterized protein
MPLEYRIHGAALRARKGAKPGIEGYAAVFNQRSEDLGGWRETVMPGAFARALREEQDVRALVNHDPSRLLARSKSGSLVLEEDAKGLRFSADLPDTQEAQNMRSLIERGDIDQCSFGFVARVQKWSEEPDPTDASRRLQVRELHDVDLFDVSVVTFPAYPQTEAYIRSLFPEGVPMEVRARVPGLLASAGLNALTADERERLLAIAESYMVRLEDTAGELAITAEQRKALLLWHEAFILK